MESAAQRRENRQESQGGRLMAEPVITRRRFLAGAAVAGAAPAALGPRIARAEIAVKIGTAVLGDYSMAGPVIVALERGFFKREGLAAEFVPFRGGPDLLKAVMAGEILVGITGSTDILVFREAGSPVKMIATHTEGNHFTLNVAADVRAVADLKGKAIGAYVWGDGGAVTELQGKSRVLLRLDAVTPKWISQIQYATEDGIRKQADTIRKCQRAMFRALKLMRDTPKEAAEICAKKLGWTPEAVLGAHKISGPLLPVDGRINVEALAAMQETLLEYGLVKKKLPLDEHFTRDFTPVRL